MKTKIVISILAAIGLYEVFAFVFDVAQNYFIAFPPEFGLLDIIVLFIIQLFVAATIYVAIGDSNHANSK